MAKRVLVEHIDDIDGTVIPPGQGETVQFGLDGVLYEIDLTSARAQELRSAMAVFVGAARNFGPAERPRATPQTRTHLVDPTAVRAWAAARGFEVPARGRLPVAIVDEYLEAGN